MITGKLSNGFKYSINERLFEDYKFMTQLFVVGEDPQNFLKFNQMLETLFGGAEQRDSFVESFMDEDGIVPIGRLADGFQELLADLKEKKKDLKN